jgi:hypothetical protein
MSNTISISDLACVVGGAGTSAQTVNQAVKNYLSDNGNGSWLSQAGALGSKVWHRAQYSGGFINYQAYADSVEAAPGGANYVADMRRLRPSR